MEPKHPGSKAYYCSSLRHLKGVGETSLAIYVHLMAVTSTSDVMDLGAPRTFDGSVENLADFLERDRSTVQRAMKPLTERGFLIDPVEVVGVGRSYRVLSHDEWAERNPGQCCVKGGGKKGRRETLASARANVDASTSTRCVDAAPTRCVDAAGTSSADATPTRCVDAAQVLRLSMEGRSEERDEVALPAPKPPTLDSGSGGQGRPLAKANVLATEIASLTSLRIGFSRRQKSKLAELLRTGADSSEVSAAFKVFYQNLNKENPRNFDFAVHDFLQVADQIIYSARRKRQEAQAQQSLISSLESESRATAQAALAAAEAADTAESALLEHAL